MDLNPPPPLCCLCGDVGFPAKLFRCVNCSTRFQHSYCSNYYCGDQSGDPILQICDWCRSQQIIRRPASTTATNNTGTTSQKDQITQRRSSGAGLPSPRPAPRRFKLLKDVLC
ncbi:unnamed protein product [Citrullus colocynthis]|uniref:PHD-type zinc finger plants domain-containing protein n=1 Tax=Citrullus colocynthis TaxID=252529 RepID=A0ABP0YJD2_9ROSI